MTFRLTPIVKWLAILQLAFFVVQQTADRYFGGHLFEIFGLIPVDFLFGFHLWQIFTYSLIHADVGHLLFNLLVLVFIGSELETFWGSRKFLQFFLFCVAFTGIVFLFVTFVFLRDSAMGAALVGSSGGLYGLLIAYGLIFSERTLLFMMMFPMKAKVFAAVLGGVALFTTLFSSGSGVLTGLSHLAGMMGGALYLILPAAIRGNLKLRLKKKKAMKRSRFELIQGGQRVAPDEDSDKRDPPTWH